MHEKVKKAQAGDLTAFGELVKIFQDAVYGVAYSMLGNFHDAQDIAQEVFIQAWRDLGSLKEPAKFPNWLCSQGSVVYFRKPPVSQGTGAWTFCGEPNSIRSSWKRLLRYMTSRPSHWNKLKRKSLQEAFSRQ